MSRFRSIRSSTPASTSSLRSDCAPRFAAGARRCRARLARFVRACRERRVAFKATAGLHHALSTGGEHGFLNLLAATVFAGDEESALAESDPAAFRVTEEAFAWRARSASGAELARVRSEDFHAIGSCSFFEPVDELEALGVLPL
jgi:hypothetical protein